jgi:hypothetical protein
VKDFFFKVRAGDVAQVVEHLHCKNEARYCVNIPKTKNMKVEKGLFGKRKGVSGRDEGR